MSLTILKSIGIIYLLIIMPSLKFSFAYCIKICYLILSIVNLLLLLTFRIFFIKSAEFLLTNEGI